MARGGGLVLSSLALCVEAEPVTRQSIPLTVGWNLVSFQVGGPLTPQAFSANLETNGLTQIWGYEAATKRWQFYKPGEISTLDLLSPGRGYWVQVSRPNKLELTGPIWSGSISLVPGWNLVGFPGLPFDPAEQLDLPSVFRGQLATVPRIWRFEGGVQQRFVGYDALAVPALSGLATVDPGRGYWVFSLGHLTLAPTASLALPADADLSPLQLEQSFNPADPRFRGSDPERYAGQIVRYAGLEDATADLNRNGLVDGPFTQDTLRFGSGVNEQLITIQNDGAGLMNWAIDEATSWLAFDPPAGVAGTESDSVRVTVDRVGMLPGTYAGAFTVYAGGVARVVHVLLDVPGVAGDYRGFASVQRVNGKPIALGRVDLNLSLFAESADPADPRFRAVIDREQSLLFPFDVTLRGIFYQGNDFSLTASFEMPAGDRNVPPYQEFQHGRGYGRLKDVDANGDGKLDNLNPFPFAVQREVTLQGRRVHPDRLEGMYVEALSGALPGGEVIYVEGTFELNRESLEPTLKPVAVGKSVGDPVTIGGSAGGRVAYTNILGVSRGVQIHALTAKVQLDFPRPAELEIDLRGPTGQTVALFRNGATLAPVQTFAVGAFNGTMGQGEWALVVSWDPASSEQGSFKGWELQLDGLELFSASGVVVANLGGVTQAVSGATVLLSGGNILPETRTAADGTFGFGGLTEDTYSLRVTMPGYRESVAGFRITRGSVEVPQIVLEPLELAEPVLAVAPALGTAPLEVELQALVPADRLATIGGVLSATWTFGDGNERVVTGEGLAPVRHVYTVPGAYRVEMVLEGGEGKVRLTNETLIVLASGPNVAALPEAAYFVWGGGFIGALASPQNKDNLIEVVGGGLPEEGIVYQESKRDMAAFDIDRAPLRPPDGNFRPTQEDTDYAVPPLGPGYEVYVPPTSQGVPQPDRFRLIGTMGGAVFSVAPARAGAFVLQSGRVED